MIWYTSTLANVLVHGCNEDGWKDAKQRTRCE